MGSMFSKGSDSTTTQAPAQIPPELLPLLNSSVANLTAFQQAFPLVSAMQDFTQPVSSLTPLELKLAGQNIGYSQSPAISYPELASLSQMNQLAGGPIGSSPATIAGMNAFDTFQKPRIQQDLALSGQATSGAYAENLWQARQTALQPLIEQEIANRVAMLYPLQALGATVAQREREDTGQALQTAAMPRQVADMQNAAAHDEMLRRAGLVSSAGLGIAQQLVPSLFTPGSTTVSQRSKK